MKLFGTKVPWVARRGYKYAILAKIDRDITDQVILTVIPPDTVMELPQGEKYVVLMTADPTFGAYLPSEYFNDKANRA